MTAPFQLVGQVLGHYRIIEQIGAGGMGIVYRAHDEQLDRDVALKVLFAGMLADESARKRFRKEALALAKLNHPNIETVFEFGNQDGVDFLVTEYIPGTTLDTNLATGALTEAEIVRLGTQLAEGLVAAHEHGVIHRDLKPGNLRLTPDGRLKILDFGLAQLMQPQGEVDLTVSLAQSQEVRGTLPYIAPEQLRGERCDARSDIWGIGAVLYEMATRRRPFPQPQTAELIGAILHQAVTPVSVHNRHITPAFESVVMKALDKKPEKRYQSARELLVTLQGITAGVGPVARAPLRWSATALGLSIILLIGLTLGLNLRGWRDRLLGRNSSSRASVPARGRRSVAVLGFKNLSGRPDEAWLSTALSEMLTTELAVGENLRTVSGENVARTRVELSLPEADSYAPDTLARIRKNLGADFVVIGSFYNGGKDAGGQVRLDLRLQDAVAGETIASVSQMGTESSLLDLVARTGESLRQKLGIGEVSTSESAGLRASLPSDTEVARLYSQGLVKLRVFDALAARELLEKAVAADPHYALAHSALAAAWSDLGFDAKAQGEAKKAFDLSAKLSREERLSVEGSYHQFANQWDKAAEVYLKLWESFPDNLDYALRLMAAQVSGGRGKEALSTLVALRNLPGPAREDPRIDLAEGSIAESLGDFKRELQAASNAVEKGERHEARLLVARALIEQGWAFDRLGELQKSADPLAKARSLFAAAGDTQGVASTQYTTAGVLYDKGDFNGAKKMYEDSLALFRQSGNRKGMAKAINAIANVLYDQGNLAAAKKTYEQALPLQREIASKSGLAGVLGNLGNVLDGQGDLAGARKMHEEALEYFAEVGDKRGMASTMGNLGLLLYEMGGLEESKKMYEQALNITQETGYKRGMAFELAGLSETLSAQGDLVAARMKGEEALAIRTEIGEQWTTAASRASLAALSLDEGQPAAAEALARQAAGEFGKLKSEENVAVTDSVLARSLLEQGKTSEAQKVIQTAQELSARSGVIPVHFEVDIAAARIRAAAANHSRQDETEAAKRSLEAVLVKASRHGYLGYEFQSRLALGEIEVKSGKTTAGRARLQALERDAKAKGFLLIARRAAATKH
ncbi:MAG: hypothetical protein DMG74_05515 [Acidobacteria bacterium]|nr:MAG: hypothetical protein DMG74_05515 [Acidobacteriota bacterium]